MKLPNVKYAIPQEILNDTIAALEFVQERYEQEATALISAALYEQDETLVRLSRKLGCQRLEMADRAAELVDFYLSL